LRKFEPALSKETEHHWTRPYSDLPHTRLSEMEYLVYKPWKQGWTKGYKSYRENFRRFSKGYGIDPGPVRYVGAEEIRKKIDQQLKQMEGEAERRVQAEIDGKEFSWPCASPKEMEEWHHDRRQWRMFHDPKWRGRWW